MRSPNKRLLGSKTKGCAYFRNPCALRAFPNVKHSGSNILFFIFYTHWKAPWLKYFIFIFIPIEFFFKFFLKTFICLLETVNSTWGWLNNGGKGLGDLLGCWEELHLSRTRLGWTSTQDEATMVKNRKKPI